MSEAPLLKLHRDRGASAWRRQIYDIVWEAWEEGQHSATCVAQGLQSLKPHDGCADTDDMLRECGRRFNMSGTVQWWAIYRKNNEVYSYDKIPPDLWAEIVEKKYRHTRVQMVTKGELIRIKGPGTSVKKPVYIKGAPPKYWHPKRYEPGRFRDYIPARGDTEARKHARRMPSGWPAEVRAELARPKPRATRMQELLEEALNIYA